MHFVRLSSRAVPALLLLTLPAALSAPATNDKGDKHEFARMGLDTQAELNVLRGVQSGTVKVPKGHFVNPPEPSRIAQRIAELEEKVKAKQDEEKKQSSSSGSRS